MNEQSDLSRLRSALREVAPESNLALLPGTLNVACFDLLHADTLSTVQVYRKEKVPKTLYLDLEVMETTPPYSRGHGRTALLSLFSLADKAGIQTVCVTACDIGRYMFAANYAQCNAKQWPGLKQKLLTRLDNYIDGSTGVQRDQRAEQAALAKPIIESSNGQLGEIVAQLRVPTIGEAPQPTLAKLLFLPDVPKGGKDEYDAYWMRAERDMARAAPRGLTVEPLLQPAVRPMTNQSSPVQTFKAG